MKSRIIFPLLLVFLTFNACQKDVVQHTPENPQVLLVSQNPFNHIGILHNKGLDFIAHKGLLQFSKDGNFSDAKDEKSVTYRDGMDIDYDLLDELTVDFFVDIVQESAYPSSNVPTLKENLHDFIGTNIAPYYNECGTASSFTDMDYILTENTSLGTSARSILVDLGDDIDNGGDNLTTLLNIITTYEGDISTTFLSASEKQILLIGCSVYRSSLEYWYNVYEEEQTPWYLTYNGGITPRAASETWKRIAYADLGGAVVGAAAGVYTGVTSGALVFGPAGVVASGVGGAVLGGLRTSASAGLGQLFYSWWGK